MDPNLYILKKRGNNMRCPECYSDNPRITPLLEPEKCLREHVQYICSTCGRHICISVKGERARCFMPFSSLEIAILYLKCAEILSQGLCGIYQFQDVKTGRISYKIYANKEDLLKFVKNNPGKVCLQPDRPNYISKKYVPVQAEQIRKLDEPEITIYLEEQKKYAKNNTQNLMA